MGGRYKGRLLGTIGDLGCFSLSTYKITGGGEGGMVLTNDEWLFTRAASQHDTAACWRPDRYAKERKPGELFCGQNYRMSELEGSVILVQLKKSGAQARRYNTNMRRVLSAVRKYDKVVPRRSNDLHGDVGYSLSYFAKEKELAGKLAEALNSEGVGAGARGTKSLSGLAHILLLGAHPRADP